MQEGASLPAGGLGVSPILKSHGVGGQERRASPTYTHRATPYAQSLLSARASGYAPDMTATELQAHLESAIQQLPAPDAEGARGPSRIDARPMFGMQAYLVRGKMFAALGAAGLLLKLPPERRQALLDTGTAGPFSVQPGTSFGEWVAVPAAQLAPTGPHALLALVRESFDYVTSAPAKPRPPREQRHFRKRMY